MSTVPQKVRLPESKRIRQFRLGIAKIIPKFPNNAETLAILEAKSLGSLLIDYINWAHRLIYPRPRKVTIEPTLTSDPRWKALSADAEALFDIVRRGGDLTPYLSLKALYKGFTPASSIADPATNKWEDKDFLLTTVGYHHFHLSQVFEKAGHAKRTDDVLFAEVTKDSFKAIGFFNHSVFEVTDSTSMKMTQERERLWIICDLRNSLGREPGKVYIGSAITTSGHALHHTHLAAEFSRIIYFIDPKLDDLSMRSEVFDYLPPEKVKGMKLRWHMEHLKLGLLDQAASSFHFLKDGGIF